MKDARSCSKLHQRYKRLRKRLTALESQEVLLKLFVDEGFGDHGTRQKLATASGRRSR